MKIILLSLAILISLNLQSSADTLYNKVIKEGKIKCGYYVTPPYFNKDPNNGSLSGIWYEYVEEIGKRLDLEIEWSLEVGLGDLTEALKSGKIDAYCAGLWNNPSRSKHIDFVTPISYQILYPFVRDNDNRFDSNLEKVNNNNIIVSCIDGEMADLIAKSDFPKAKRSCLPQLSPYSDILTNISNGKADITFASPSLVEAFNANNPDKKLKQVKTENPIRIFPESLALNYGEHDFRRMLDHTTRFLINSGFINNVLKKYEGEYGSFYIVKEPYKDKH